MSGDGKTLMGKIVSDKMQKTVVVEVIRSVRHKLYHKYMRLSKKYHAHVEDIECTVGDTVKIIETKPRSKTKTWDVVEVIDRAR